MPRLTKQELLRLQKTLLVDQKIADKFGITRQAVHQIREKYGIPCILNRNRKRNDQINRLYNGGIPVVGIAKKFKLSICQIYRVIR